MKGILEFDTDEPFEREEFLAAAQAKELFLCLFDFSEYLRKRIKECEDSDERYYLLECVNEKFFEILDEYRISLNMLS